MGRVSCGRFLPPESAGDAVTSLLVRVLLLVTINPAIVQCQCR